MNYLLYWNPVCGVKALTLRSQIADFLILESQMVLQKIVPEELDAKTKKCVGKFATFKIININMNLNMKKPPAGKAAEPNGRIV